MGLISTSYGGDDPAQDAPNPARALLVILAGFLTMVLWWRLVPWGWAPASLWFVLTWLLPKCIDLAIVLATLALLIGYCRYSPENLGLGRKLIGRQCLQALVLTILMRVVLFVLLWLTSEAGRAADTQILEPAAARAGQLLSRTMAMIVLINLISVIAEEVMFRGMLTLLFSRLIASKAGAVIISTAVFSVSHYEAGMNAMIGAVAMGLVLGVGVLITRSLYVVIAAHLAHNLISLGYIHLFI